MQPQSVGELSAALASLLADPSLRQRLGERARDRAERDLTIGASVDRYLQAYQEALDGR